MRGCAPKVSIPGEGKVPLGEVASSCEQGEPPLERECQARAATDPRGRASMEEESMSSIMLRAVVALSGLALVCAAHAQQKVAAAPKKAAAHTNKAAPVHLDPVAADFAKFHALMEEDS